MNKIDGQFVSQKSGILANFFFWGMTVLTAIEKENLPVSWKNCSNFLVTFIVDCVGELFEASLLFDSFKLVSSLSRKRDQTRDRSDVMDCVVVAASKRTVKIFRRMSRLPKIVCESRPKISFSVTDAIVGNKKLDCD